MERIETCKGAQLLRRVINKECVWKIEVLTKWQEKFGKTGNKVVIEKILDDKIFLRTKDSCMSHELSMQKDQILKVINKMVAPFVFKDLSIKPNGPASFFALSKKTLPKPDSLKSVNLCDSDVNLTVGEKVALDKIKSQELKESLEAFWIRCKQIQAFLK